MELARNLEQFRAALVAFHSGFRVDPPRPSFVFAFAKEESYHPYKLRSDGKPLPVAGTFIARRDANFITIEASSRKDSWHTVFHEYTHEFLSNNMGVIPRWFDEGVAEFYSTFTGDESSLSVGRPVVEYVQYLSMNRILPLSQLFAQDYSHELLADSVRRSTYYAQSWALVHFLLSSSAERRTQTGKFLDAVSDGVPMEKAFGRAFNTSYAAMADELSDYVARGRFSFSSVPMTSQFLADSSARVTAISRAEALSRLGHLLTHVQRERLGDAEAHFREALRLEPDHPRALHGMGTVLSKQGRFDEAIPLYARASGPLAGDPVFYYDYATSILRRVSGEGHEAAGGAVGAQEKARAKAILEQALKAKPDYAEVYVELGRLASEEPGGLDETISALQKARSLMPSRMDIVANLIGSFLRAGKRDEAQTLYERALRPSKDQEIIKWADAAFAAYDRQQADAARRSAGAGLSSGELSEEAGIPADQRGPTSTATPQESHQESYNRAVDLANEQNLPAALAILEVLVVEVKEPELLDSVRELYSSLLHRMREQAKPGEVAPPPTGPKP